MDDGAETGPWLGCVEQILPMHFVQSHFLIQVGCQLNCIFRQIIDYPISLDKLGNPLVTAVTFPFGSCASFYICSKKYEMLGEIQGQGSPWVKK